MNLIPKTFKRMKPRDQAITLILGGSAVLGTLYVLHQLIRTPHQSPASRIAVSGMWTDLAQKLGISIGADMSIKTAQQYLNQVSKAGLKENGVLDTATSNAIRKFQRGNGLQETGVIDDETGNALSYMVAATSPSQAVRKYATVTPAHLPPAPAQRQVTYAPAPMPQPVPRYYRPPPPPVAYSPYPMPPLQPPPPQQQYAGPPSLSPQQEWQFANAQPGAPMDLGGGWIAFGNCACLTTDQACIASCGGQPMTAGMWDHTVGAQSTQMYDPRFMYGSWGN